MPTQTLNRVVCIDDDGDIYTLTIPAADEPSACALAESQGHRVATPSDRAKSDSAVQGRAESNLSKVALSLSFAGLLFAPLAMIGLVLGAQERNRAAVVVGAVALIGWLVVVAAIASA